MSTHGRKGSRLARGEMRRVAWAACLVLGIHGAAAAQAEPPAPPPDGVHATPSLYWQEGPHRLDLGLSTRVRPENWEAFSDDRSSWYTGTRTRLRLQYNWADRILLAAELQDVRLNGMDVDGTGALSLYRNANGGGSQSRGDDVRSLYLETRPTAKSYLRGGRQDLKLGSQEVQYAEPN